MKRGIGGTEGKGEEAERKRWVALQPQCGTCQRQSGAPDCARLYNYIGARGPGGALIVRECTGYTGASQ